MPMSFSPPRGPNDKPFLRIVGANEKAADPKPAVPELNETIGARVKEIRKAQKLSRRELSERSDVSVRYLAKLEHGDGNASVGLLQKLARALEIPLEVFLADEDPHAREVKDVVTLFKHADAHTRFRVLQILDPERAQKCKAQRLCLVGLRGAGKSTLGRSVAAEFQVPFIELNDVVEAKAGMPIGEIIALYGQEGYRKLEADSLTETIKRHHRAVIAVAGGIVSEQTTFSRVLSGSHTIWLKATAGDHMERVRGQGDIRPINGNPKAMVQLRQILKERETHYAQANHVLDTSGKTVASSYKELSDLVRSLGIFAAAERN